jgi:hypothetical protein
VRRTRTSSQRRLRILVAMRINLEQTPAPTRNARVASATRAYARWSSKASATTAQHVRSLRHECSRRLARPWLALVAAGSQLMQTSSSNCLAQTPPHWEMIHHRQFCRGNRNAIPSYSGIAAR